MNTIKDSGMVSLSMLLFRARHYHKVFGDKTPVALRKQISNNAARQREISLYSSEFRKLAHENFQLTNYAEALDGIYAAGYTVHVCDQFGLKVNA